MPVTEDQHTVAGRVLSPGRFCINSCAIGSDGEILAALRGRGCAGGHKVRTAPLWGVRLRLVHDGSTVTLRDAVTRHAGEAAEVKRHFEKLLDADQEAIHQFLSSV